MNIREYAEGMDVVIRKDDDTTRHGDGSTRYVVHALNEGGYNCTDVDLKDIIAYVKENLPELLVD